MKTAVEWLFNQLSINNITLDKGTKAHCEMEQKILEQAKEMEKKQHYQTWNNAYDKGTRDRLEKVVDPVGDADTYFKETFKTE
jgi:hypothetical protein